MGPVKDGRLLFSCIEPEGTVLAQPLLQVREGLHQEEELQVGQGHGQPTQHRPHLQYTAEKVKIFYYTRLEKCWRISLSVTDDAIAML